MTSEVGDRGFGDGLAREEFRRGRGLLAVRWPIRWPGTVRGRLKDTICECKWTCFPGWMPEGGASGMAYYRGPRREFL